MSTKQKRSLGPAPLLYPEPALLIATYDSNGKPNVMTAAWAGICASDPVSLMVAVQPPRHTHDALLARAYQELIWTEVLEFCNLSLLDIERLFHGGILWRNPIPLIYANRY